ncbi:PepSY-associated TM helix domain-containing protein [Metabacillus sp. SLBN-84]
MNSQARKHEIIEERLHEKSETNKKKARSSLYQAVWRWHFYAGIFFAPFLIILAFSGGVYLFKPEIENFLYKDLYFAEETGTESQSPSALVSEVKKELPESAVTSIKFYDDPARTAEIGVMQNGQMSSVYINPYSGEVQGSLKAKEKFTEIFKKIHSELLVGGTAANRLVELAACWAVILLLTGLYIWFPRNKASIWGTVLPRFTKNSRTFWRDMHAVPAFWFSVAIFVLIATGLPWSGVMGGQISKLATATNTGAPPFAYSWGEKPESALTKDVAEDVSWAAENIPVPASNVQALPISLEDVQFLSEEQNVAKPYTISMPQGEKGVYTVSASHPNPSTDATLHIDQYSGAVLSDVRFDDYGIMAKLISYGISLHEGTLFGKANQIGGLIVCLGLIGLIVSSFILWRKRKPKSRAGAPAQTKHKNTARGVLIMMLILGVIMPLVGISIIAVYLLDRFVLRKIKPLKAWIG